MALDGFRAERSTGIEPDVALLVMHSGQAFDFFAKSSPKLASVVPQNDPGALARFLTGAAPIKIGVRHDEAGALPVDQGGLAPGLPTQGDLMIVERERDGTRLRVDYRNMFLHEARVVDQSADPALLEVTLADVRRFWPFYGEVSARINTRGGDERLLKEEAVQRVNLRRFLVGRVLPALPGQPELAYLPGDVGDDTPPIAAWGALAAEILQGILERYGLLVSLHLDGKLSLHRPGEGEIEGLGGGVIGGEDRTGIVEGRWLNREVRTDRRYVPRRAVETPDEVTVVGNRRVYSVALEYCTPVVQVTRTNGLTVTTETVDATPRNLRRLCGIPLNDMSYDDLWLKPNGAAWPPQLASVPQEIQHAIRTQLFRRYRVSDRYQSFLPLHDRVVYPDVLDDQAQEAELARLKDRQDEPIPEQERQDNAKRIAELARRPRPTLENPGAPERQPPVAEVFSYEPRELYLGSFSDAELEDGQIRYVVKHGSILTGALDTLGGIGIREEDVERVRRESEETGLIAVALRPEDQPDSRERTLITQNEQKLETVMGRIQRLERELKKRRGATAAESAAWATAAYGDVVRELERVSSPEELFGLRAGIAGSLGLTGFLVEGETSNQPSGVPTATPGEIAQGLKRWGSAQLSGLSGTTPIADLEDQALEVELEALRKEAAALRATIDPGDAARRELTAINAQIEAAERDTGVQATELRRRAEALAAQVEAAEATKAERHKRQDRFRHMFVMRPRRAVTVRVLDRDRGIFELDEPAVWLADPFAESEADTFVVPMPVRLQTGSWGSLGIPRRTAPLLDPEGFLARFQQNVVSTAAAELQGFFAGLGSITPKLRRNRTDAVLESRTYDVIHEEQVIFTFDRENVDDPGGQDAAVSDLAYPIRDRSLLGLVGPPAERFPDGPSNELELRERARRQALAVMRPPRREAGTITIQGPWPQDCNGRLTGLAHEARGNGLVTVLSFDRPDEPFDGLRKTWRQLSNVQLRFGIEVEGL